jgi:hypothetical protein
MATKSHGCSQGKDSDVEYFLTVYTPKRKQSMRPAASHRTHIPKNEGGYMIYTPKPNPGVKQYNGFEFKDLVDMKTKEVKISERDLMFKCHHIQELGVRECKVGCYVLEKGGNNSDWDCQRADCQGHVYSGPSAWANNGFACFGKKGERMVCIDPKLDLSVI